MILARRKARRRETNMRTSSGIKDKVVIITGASSGIGEATALPSLSAVRRSSLGRADRIALSLWRLASRMRVVKSPMHART
jgi:NADP-dependent 3-hydroxy acid dehydrogenase YdfG